MDEKIRVVSLGGLDEDGKNLCVVEIDEEIFVLESGVRFPDKTMPGIDYLISNFDYLKDHRSKVRAYILTHGHDDEIGAIPYMYKHVPAPIYGSDVTLKLLKSFCEHIRFDHSILDLRVVKPTSDVYIDGRLVHFFHTAHNIAESMGVAITTSLGNIVFTGDYVVENNATKDYLHDMNAIARIAERETLLLMTESSYADRLGYTAPKYKLTPLLNHFMSEVNGRLFVSLFSQNFYNIDEVIALAIKYKKKIVFYDQETSGLFYNLQQVNQLLIPKANYVDLADLNRIRASETLVLMLGYGDRLYKKIIALANSLQEDRRLDLVSSDAYFVAAPPSSNVEVIATEAIDDLYRSGVKVKNLTRKDILKMHASEEDLKMIIATLKPKYYLPLKGSYRHLLANAQLALSMGLNFSHQNVFVLDNGIVLEINKERARILPDLVKTGDLIIDGKGVGDVESHVISERQKLSDDGVILLGATISFKTKEIIAGPDVQIRGFVFLKDADSILREIIKIFVQTIEEAFINNEQNLLTTENLVSENVLKYVRRVSRKSPLIIPTIFRL